jgi:serine/threonine-protein kinase
LRVLRQAAAGLAAAHAAGVVHRDVKPANLLVGRDDVVKVTDFGIASSTASVPLTQTGQVIGTAHYLSPEQAQGARATPASDVYALGMVAYECLSGRRAFDGEGSVQVALMQIRDVPPPLSPDVPRAVRQLVQAALAKDPAQRLPDGAAFRDAVDAVLAGREPALPAAPTSSILVPGLRPAVAATSSDRSGPEPVDAAAGTPARGLEPRSRKPRPRLLAACLALVAAGLVAVGVLHATGDPTPAAAAGAATTGTAPSRPVVQLDPDDYVGLPLGAVEARLAALGLHVRVREIATTDVPAGQVIALGPTGQLAPGQVVTVTAAVAPAPGSAPTAPTSAAPAPGAVPVGTGGGATAGSPSPAPSSVVVQEAGQTAPKGNGGGNGRALGHGKQGGG